MEGGQARVARRVQVGVGCGPPFACLRREKAGNPSACVRSRTSCTRLCAWCTPNLALARELGKVGQLARLAQDVLERLERVQVGRRQVAHARGWDHVVDGVREPVVQQPKVEMVGALVLSKKKKPGRGSTEDNEVNEDSWAQPPRIGPPAGSS